MQVIMPAFHDRISPLVTCDVRNQIDNGLCCCLVQAANAETSGTGDVLVKLCVTHADGCGASANLSPHIPQMFMQFIRLCVKRSIKNKPPAAMIFHHKSAEFPTANIAWLREGQGVIPLY